MPTAVLTYDDTPKSANAGGGGRGKHWGAGAREKLMWEGVYGMLLLKARLPKMSHVTVRAELQFTRPRTKRDPDNFMFGVSKPLGDALVKVGLIPDDNPKHYLFDGLTISEEKLTGVSKLVTGRTVITLDYDPAD